MNCQNLPVIVAPMFLVSGVELVVNCCKEGVIGSFPSLNARTNNEFETMLKSIQSHLSYKECKTKTYAVNLIVHQSNARLEEDLNSCIKYKVPIIITSLGVRQELIEKIHDYGGKVFHDVISKRHALKAAEYNVDGLILVCNGAGGHAGTANPFAFIQEVKRFFNKTIILSGAITNGRDILAAQILGADYAYMGTRFIATKESLASEEYKNMLLNSEIADIIYTDKISGVFANFLKPSIVNANIPLETLEVPKPEFATKENSKKAWKDIWSAGHGVTGIYEIISVKSLVDLLKKEYQDALILTQRISKNYL